MEFVPFSVGTDGAEVGEPRRTGLGQEITNATDDQLQNLIGIAGKAGILEIKYPAFADAASDKVLAAKMLMVLAALASTDYDLSQEEKYATIIQDLRTSIFGAGVTDPVGVRVLGSLWPEGAKREFKVRSEDGNGTIHIQHIPF